MTTGQKIAAKRRELELSQEALGDKLGVSRQTIYKWESDTSLPEIEKLVALSRLFQVPVGWLLGAEEEPAKGGSDFSPEQLKLLEEILGRYQQAGQENLSPGQREQVEELVRQGRGAGRKRRRWPWVLAGLILVWAGWSLFRRLDQLEQQYYDLGNSVGNITYSVNSQIGSITRQVEDVLKSMNELTADYSVAYTSLDLASNTVTFSLRVVPKTYTPGMSVLFLVDNGKETLEFPAQEGENGVFTREASCPITDGITLSAVFVTGETRQTQLLDQYSGLYSDSFPYVDVSGPWTLHQVEDFAQGDGSFRIPEDYVTVRMRDQPELNQSQVGTVQVGLFRNQRLVQWLEPCEQPSNYHGFEDHDFYRMEPLELTLEEGDEVGFAALCTDQYGRQWMQSDVPFVVVGGALTYPEQYESTSDPEDWEFTAE